MTILLVSLTVYSQPTNIPDSTKRELVITLESYPIVLRELDVANQLIENQQLTIEKLQLQIVQHNLLVKTKNSQIKNLEEQIEVHTIEVKKLKRKSTTLILGGGIIVTTLIVLSL